MSYYTGLSFNLRLRGLPEAEVLAALREVEQHVQLSGQSPAEAFGSPSEYAAKFPELGRGRTVKVAIALLVVATSLVLLNLILGLVGHAYADGLVLIGCGAFVFIIGTVLSAAVDHRLPQGFQPNVSSP